MIFVYTTCTSMDEGRELSQNLISKKLASAVNFWPAHSVFSAKGQLREGTGSVLFIRTLEKHLQEIEDLIADTMKGIPCIAALDVKRINRHYKEHMVDAMA
jgi:uncharacterized protein involved in tolerance to divalent cations